MFNSSALDSADLTRKTEIMLNSGSHIVNFDTNYLNYQAQSIHMLIVKAQIKEVVKSTGTHVDNVSADFGDKLNE